MKRLLASAAFASALTLTCPGLASAQEPFLGEVRLFGFNFCPLGWLAANGQLLPLNQFTALFSLLGTTYGGNGTTNFSLPDLRGRAPVAPTPPAGDGRRLRCPVRYPDHGATPRAHSCTPRHVPAPCHEQSFRFAARHISRY